MSKQQAQSDHFTDNSLGYRINYLARVFEEELRERIKAYGVVPGQFAQLLTLYEEGPLTQQELCERVHIEQPTMAKTLQRMERDGLIVRVPDPTDKRRAHIHLTARAKGLRNILIATAQPINDTALRGLTQEETLQFIDTLRLIERNLSK